MNIWTAPLGAHLELGQQPDLDHAAGLPDLDHAARVLGLVASTLQGRASLAGMTWHPVNLPPTTPIRLRLTLMDRAADGRFAALRLHAIGPSGGANLLADLRLARHPSPAPTAHDLLTTALRPGDRNETAFVVDETMVTGHVPGRAAVLTTPDLVLQLEGVAAGVLRPRLAAHASSVGTWIGVRHTAAALPGERVDLCATVADIRGRRVTFDVSARVGDRLIGDGQVGQTLIPNNQRVPGQP